MGAVVNSGAVRRAAGYVLGVGGVIAMPVAFLAFRNLPAFYSAAVAAIAGGIVLGVGALGLLLLAVGAVGGFCCLVAFLGAEGDTIPLHLQVFAWTTVFCLVAGLVALAFSVWRSTKGRGWPWPH